jgi:hypothetical protein
MGLLSSDSVAAFFYPWEIVVPRLNLSPLVFLEAGLRPGDNQPCGTVTLKYGYILSQLPTPPWESNET